jgi:hypothetical protein
MKIFAMAMAAVCAVTGCDAPGAVSSAQPDRTAALASGGTVAAPACEDIQFVSLCLPADCYHRKDTARSHSLSRHALCPTINNCRSYVDIVAKTRTCDETGCSNHALGFLRCYEPGDDDGND